MPKEMTPVPGAGLGASARPIKAADSGLVALASFALTPSA
jgi:hypothetical protein